MKISKELMQQTNKRNAYIIIHKYTNIYINLLIYAYITKIGPKQQDKPAKEFVLNLYMACNPDPERQTYSHFTTATGVFAMKNATTYTMRHLVLSYSPCCIHSVISLWLKNVGNSYCVFVSMLFYNEDAAKCIFSQE